jgi:RecB family exonuclease
LGIVIALEKIWSDAWTFESKDRSYDLIPKDSFRQSTRTTKANPNGENYDWWFINGKTFLNNWIDWRKGSGWKLWTTPEGLPAIELMIQIEVGGVQMKGAIDRVFVTPEGELVILDLKTGIRTPQSDLQLQVYACMMERALGIRPSYGVYWMARQGSTSIPTSLDKFTLRKLDEMVALFQKARENNLYLPNFEGCKLCSYQEHCYWVDGKNHLPLGEVINVK